MKTRTFFVTNFAQVEFSMVWLAKPAIQVIVADKIKLHLKTVGIPDI
jgi:hypothetical protein